MDMEEQDSLAPGFLIAVPQLKDPHFDHTVTLLVEASPEGAFGLVVNRMSPIKLADVCAQNDLSCTRDDFIHIGGPVDQERAWVLHGPGIRSADSLEITDGILLTATWEVLGELAQSREEMLVCLGYAGWGPGQLEQELSEGAWLVAPLDRDILFRTAGKDMWRKVIEKMGLDPGRIGTGGGVH